MFRAAQTNTTAIAFDHFKGERRNRDLPFRKPTKKCNRARYFPTSLQRPLDARSPSVGTW